MVARESGENTNENIDLEQIVMQIKEHGDPDGKLMLELLSGTERFARMIARPFIPNVIDEGELQGISFLAMSEAVRRFDPIAGAGILTVFRWTLTRELINETTRSGVVYIPHHLLKRLRAFRQARKSLMQELSSEPPDIVLAHHMNITVGEVREIRRVEVLLSPARLDAPITDDGETTLADTVPDNARVEDDVIDGVYLDGLRGALEDVLEALPADEKEAVLLHHGHGVTFREIAERQAVTVERCRQKCMRGMRKLQNNADKLREYHDTNYHKRTSFSHWKASGNSQEEAYILWQEERKNSRPDDFMESTMRLLRSKNEP